MKDLNLTCTEINPGLFLTDKGILISTCGQIVTMDQIRSVLMNDGIPPKLTLGDNNLWGYVDKDDEWIIDPRYEQAKEFKNGKAMVLSKNYWVQINEFGVWI